MNKVSSVALPETESKISPVTLREAFLFWLKLGFISFGGPAGQISIMHQELVENRRWLSERRFLHALNFCMVLPGPEAQQLATYIGWLMHKTWGGVLAGLLFILPSLLLLIALSWIYIAWGDVAVVAGIFYGIKPAVAAIVLQAAHRIGSRALKNGTHWAIAAAAFIAVFALNVSFPLIVIFAAVAGFIGGRMAQENFTGGNEHKVQDKRYGAAVIDDNTPLSAHAVFSWLRMAKVIAAGAVLWFIPMVSLVALVGWDHPVTQMSWFFTKAALLTFGGAYAVLPYIYQGAVTHFSWLTPGQMMDGLALGETTPGPLIMVVTFVGFVGGYTKAVFGPDTLFIGGAVAACLVTWFTFLPSFIFILAGGPFIETTHNKIGFTAPLTAITAAVVGVILNLALFFIWHIIWPAGAEGGIDVWAAVIAVASAVALFRYKWKVTHVIAAAAMMGLAVHLFGFSPV